MTRYDNTEWETRAFAAVPPRLWWEATQPAEIRRVELRTDVDGNVFVLAPDSQGVRWKVHGVRVRRHSTEIDRWLAEFADRVIPGLDPADDSFEGAVRALAAWLAAVGVEVTTDERPLRRILDAAGLATPGVTAEEARRMTAAWNVWQARRKEGR